MRDLDLARRVHAKSDTIFAANDCHQQHSTFGAFGPDLRPLDLTPERLLVDVVKAWGYLIERDTRVLIVAAATRSASPSSSSARRVPLATLNSARTRDSSRLVSRERSVSWRRPICQWCVALFDLAAARKACE